MELQRYNEEFARYAYEPSLEELLDEPIVRKLMARDGVEQGKLQHELANLARAVAARKLARC